MAAPKHILGPAKKHCFLRLAASTHQWWTEQVIRIARKENLLQFSLTGLLHRVAAANLDLSNAALERYKATRV